MFHICNTEYGVDILVCQNVCIEKYCFRFRMTRTCSHISFLFASHSVVSRVVCIITFLKTDIPNVEDIFDLLSRETYTLRRSLPRFCEFSSTTLIRIKCRLDTYLTLTFSVNGFQPSNMYIWWHLQWKFGWRFLWFYIHCFSQLHNYNIITHNQKLTYSAKPKNICSTGASYISVEQCLEIRGRYFTVSH